MVVRLAKQYWGKNALCTDQFYGKKCYKHSRSFCQIHAAIFYLAKIIGTYAVCDIIINRFVVSCTMHYRRCSSMLLGTTTVSTTANNKDQARTS